MNKSSGFFKIIIILVIAVIALSLMGFSLGDLARNEKIKENFSYIKNLGAKAWEKMTAPLRKQSNAEIFQEWQGSLYS
ncbi:hypothetical protein HYT00_01545 [Candidatus Giovannonibacteria bacterium]|nr:hypothetical protein [Candidatus Giovannonibacteria bacterium]